MPARVPITRASSAENLRQRTFTLPATVALEKIKATYENGLLAITLPKVEAAKPHLIEVEVTPQKTLK